jgi:hypothetical protein
MHSAICYLLSAAGPCPRNKKTTKKRQHGLQQKTQKAKNAITQQKQETNNTVKSAAKRKQPEAGCGWR